MDPVFSIGISSLWDELRHMPAGGVWWFNVDRHEDAISLANQTIASQAETAHVAVISMDSDPAKIFQLDDSQGPEKIKLFSMLNHEKGLYYLTRDLGNDSNLLIVFYVQIMPDDLVMQLHRF